MKTANTQLIKFIRTARERGFDDFQIKEPLIKKGWPIDEIECAFASLKPKYKFKNKISIFLDSDILKIIDKRAKKNLMTTSEQIEDILRRSCINLKNQDKNAKDNIDDMLVSIFSRKK